MTSSAARRTGVLTDWNDDRGFGFLDTDGHRTFVHISAFGSRSGRPQIGDVIEYRLGTAPDGRERAEYARHSAARSTRVSSPRRTAKRGTAAGNGWVLVPVVAMVAGLAVAVLFFGATPLIPAAYLVMSLVTYVLYDTDKRAALAGTWRTTELMLQLAALFCGWPGAAIAQHVLRHKNRKADFQLTFWAVVLLNVILCATVMWAWPVVLPALLG